MKVATKANVRTAKRRPFRSESGPGSCLYRRFCDGSCCSRPRCSGAERFFSSFYSNIFTDINQVITVITGFSFGASSIALFARVGGGIYTKAADVGADLVGKVEAGIPEDHPLNPATIADNVGDNVGDVAGMGADLFESFVGSIIAAMVLGAVFMGLSEFAGNPLAGVLLPLFLASTGIVISIVGTFFVRVKEGGDPHKALNLGEFGSAGIMIVAFYFLITNMLPEQWTFTDPLYGDTREFTAMGIFFATIIGLVSGVLIGVITEYYTGYGKKTGSSDCRAVAHRCRNQYYFRSAGGYDVYRFTGHRYRTRNHRCFRIRRTVRYCYCRCGDAGEHRYTACCGCLRPYIRQCRWYCRNG